MTSMKFCRAGRPITPGAWQTHTDHACEVAMPAGVVREAEDSAQPGREAVRRCALCGSLGDLEPINAGPSLACVNTDMCQLRAITSDPLELLARAARGTAKDVTRLSEIELARVILTLKATVKAAEIELGNNRERARGDAALAQAAGELAPRTPQAQELACCTSAIGPVCRHRTTPVADALQEVNYWQDKGVIVSHPSGDGELAALRKLADAVRSHGIGADLAARRPDCTDPACAGQACPEHPGHQGDEHTYEQHHSPRDHVGPGPCRCPG